MIEVENIQKWVFGGVDSRYYVASNRLFKEFYLSGFIF